MVTFCTISVLTMYYQVRRFRLMLKFKDTKKGLILAKKTFQNGGSYWVRTSDPLLVRQML